MAYNPFSPWDGFTNDSVDSGWMAKFCDFTSNDLDDSNPDFELDDDGYVHLSQLESLDLNIYCHLHMADAYVWSDYVRAKYHDGNWIKVKVR